MNLSEFMQQPLLVALENMDLVDTKVHTNGDGQVQSLELKYRPKDAKAAPACTPQPAYLNHLSSGYGVVR